MGLSDSIDAVCLPERLTLQEAVAELDRLGRAVKQQPGPVVALDASALKVFDSSVVAVLLELRRGLLPQGKTLTVVEWPEHLRDLVSLYGVNELLPG